MNRLLGLAAIVAGVVLLIFGFNAADSLSSEVSEFFSGNPSDKSMWMMIGGAVLVVVGLGLTLLRGKST